MLRVGGQSESAPSHIYVWAVARYMGYSVHLHPASVQTAKAIMNWIRLLNPTTSVMRGVCSPLDSLTQSHTARQTAAQENQHTNIHIHYWQFKNTHRLVTSWPSRICNYLWPVKRVNDICTAAGRKRNERKCAATVAPHATADTQNWFPGTR